MPEALTDEYGDARGADRQRPALGHQGARAVGAAGAEPAHVRVWRRAAAFPPAGADARGALPPRGVPEDQGRGGRGDAAARDARVVPVWRPAARGVGAPGAARRVARPRV